METHGNCQNLMELGIVDPNRNRKWVTRSLGEQEVILQDVDTFVFIVDFVFVFSLARGDLDIQAIKNFRHLE